MKAESEVGRSQTHKAEASLPPNKALGARQLPELPALHDGLSQDTQGPAGPGSSKLSSG